MVIYINGKETGGKRGTYSGGCPISPDCYLCKFSGCRSYSDGSYRLQGVKPEDIETIKKRAIISHVIKEKGDEKKMRRSKKQLNAISRAYAAKREALVREKIIKIDGDLSRFEKSKYKTMRGYLNMRQREFMGVYCGNS